MTMTGNVGFDGGTRPGVGGNSSNRNPASRSIPFYGGGQGLAILNRIHAFFDHACEVVVYLYLLFGHLEIDPLRCVVTVILRFYTESCHVENFDTPIPITYL